MGGGRIEVSRRGKDGNKRRERRGKKRERPLSISCRSAISLTFITPAAENSLRHCER